MSRNQLPVALVTTGLILAIAACTLEVVTDYLHERAHVERCGGDQ